MVLRSKVGMVTVPILIDNYHFHGHGGLGYRGTAGTAAHMIFSVLRLTTLKYERRMTIVERNICRHEWQLFASGRSLES